MGAGAGAGRVLNVAVALLLGAGLPQPCAPCVARGDHLSCSGVPFHRFPDTDAGLRHVALSGARLGALGEAALDARALRTLVLVGSRLHHVDARAFASMASTLASLDLGHNEFTEVPIEALRELRALNWLNLQNNLITDLEVDMDWGSLGDCLSSLSLGNNRLSELGAGALLGLRYLAQLDLDGNRLHALHAAALPPSLALLRLADNLLPRAPCDALARLPRLRALHLRGNALHAAANGSCAGSPFAIDSLDIGGNQLDDRYEPPFAGGLRLRQLVLDLNEFTVVPAFAAAGGRLQKLSAAYNRIGRVSDAAVRALKRDLERLDLDHNELAEMPESVRELSRLRYLSVAYNHLTELNHLPPRLLSLSLAGNYLTTLPAALRASAPATLAYLDVGYNQISSLAPEAFGPWSEALATFNLKGNRLTQLSADVFPATLPLRELMLSFNDLYYVDPHAFANLTRLRLLELSSTLFNGEFPVASPLDGLSWLSLDNNNIHFVSTEDLLSFSSLEYLNLDFNKIIEFPREAVPSSRPSSLKELSLAYNYIGKVDLELFGGLPVLQSLDLSYNRLRNVTENKFAGLPELTYLSLAGNELEVLAPGAFRHLPRLEAIDIHGNRLIEFSTEIFENVSKEDTGLSVNASFNRIAAVDGGAPVPVHVLDLSHNALETLSRAFFEAVGPSLRRLLLSHNRLTHVDGARAVAVPNLEALDLRHNAVGATAKKFAADAAALQVFDLSHNRLTQLTGERFHNMRRLRHLRLDSNGLRSLPRDAFKNTVLEYLDLSDNRLAAPPGGALAQVGFTLRRLELAANRVARLDAAAFHATPFLLELSLARNALAALADDAFAGLARLRRLDLSGNPVEANFKELFHRLPKLRSLALAGCGLKTLPNLALADLRELDVSGNLIASYRETDVRGLGELRALNLAGNRLTSLQPALWAGVRRLAALDVSDNPVVRVTRGSFEGLERLLALRMHRLRGLEAVEPKAFRPLAALRSLELETPLAPGVPPAAVVALTPALEALTVHAREDALDGQLRGLRAPRLRALEVRGAGVRRVAAHAFSALGGQRALRVRVAGTAVRALPAGLLRPLARVPRLALDLSGNRLEALAPAAFYPNLTGWNRLATKLLPGGLVLSANPLRCGCAVAWLGAWLRRWTAEVAGGGPAAREAARGPRCTAPRDPRDPRGASEGTALPLLALTPDEAECHASALSGRAPRPRPPAGVAAGLLLALLRALAA